jgi:hypothetical protein
MLIVKNRNGCRRSNDLNAKENGVEAFKLMLKIGHLYGA